MSSGGAADTMNFELDDAQLQKTLWVSLSLLMSSYFPSDDSLTFRHHAACILGQAFR